MQSVYWRCDSKEMHLAGTLKAFHQPLVGASFVRIAGKGKDLSIKLLDGGSGCLTRA